MPANFERSQLDAYLRNLTWDDVLRPHVLAAARALVERGHVASIGLLGFCWGGCPVTHALADAELTAALPLRCGAIAHPSLSLEQRVFGRDPAALLARVRAPLLLLPAKNDPAEYRAGGAWLEALQGAQPASRCVEFNEMTHGWVPRGDLGDAAVARDVQRAIDEIVAFFNAHL